MWISLLGVSLILTVEYEIGPFHTVAAMMLSLEMICWVSNYSTLMHCSNWSKILLSALGFVHTDLNTLLENVDDDVDISLVHIYIYIYF